MDGGQNVNKLKALSVLFRCAELYRDNLVGNNLLFVCSDKHLNVKMFPVADMIPAMIIVMPVSWFWMTYVLPLVS